MVSSAQSKIYIYFISVTKFQDRTALTCGVGGRLVVPQCPQGAVGSGERWAPWVGSEAAPDWVVLEAVGLAAGTEVCIGRGFHGCHAGIIRIQVGIIHFVHRGSWKERLRRRFCRRFAGLLFLKVHVL